MTEEHHCRCGGEVMADSFDPIRRPVEWFMRCLSCGAMGPVCRTREEAEKSILETEHHGSA